MTSHRQELTGHGKLKTLLWRAPTAAHEFGVSLRTWRSWDASARIPRPIRIGRSVFWRADELRAWVDAGCPSRDEWETR